MLIRGDVNTDTAKYSLLCFSNWTILFLFFSPDYGNMVVDSFYSNGVLFLLWSASSEVS